jgi:predicted DNA-binding transcriptional regulator AlpA
VQDLFTNVKGFREDAAVPKNPEREGSPRLMSISDIAAEHGVSRVSIHAYRRRGDFPQPVPVSGTTALRWREDEVAAFFEANPKQPGKRTDLAPRDEGAPMAATERTEAGISDETVERLGMMLSYQSGIAAQTVGLPEGQARELAEAVVETVEALAARWADQ